MFDYDATAVVRLREAGAVLLGKLATGELAVGDLWFRRRTRNPWSPSRGSSGSSAGPASAAAAGSRRDLPSARKRADRSCRPRSTCGVVGLRPTYGRVSRYGCMTLRWTLDKVGPLARSVDDTALVLEALHGPDGHDETVTDAPFTWDGDRTVKGVRIGYVEREIAVRRRRRRNVTGARTRRCRAACRLPQGGRDARAHHAARSAGGGDLRAAQRRSRRDVRRTRAQGGINELADQGRTAAPISCARRGLFRPWTTSARSASARCWFGR